MPSTLREGLRKETIRAQTVPDSHVEDRGHVDEPPFRNSLLATDYSELGIRMRVLRETRGISLAEMAGQAPPDSPISESVLRRYEKGVRPHPKVSKAALLDHLYGGDGWIEMSIRQLGGAVWSPWNEAWPETRHVVTWPAELQADVWLRVVPTPHSVGQEHSFLLTWGPWRRQCSAVLAADGLFLTTGKARDKNGRSVELLFSCVDHPVFLIHGAGLPPSDGVSVLDIRYGWESPDDDSRP